MALRLGFTGLACAVGSVLPWTLVEVVRVLNLGHAARRPAFLAAVFLMYAVLAVPVGLLGTAMVQAWWRRLPAWWRADPAPALASVLLPAMATGWGTLLALGYVNVSFLPGLLHPLSLTLDLVGLGAASFLSYRVVRSLLEHRVLFRSRLRSLGLWLGAALLGLIPTASLMARDGGEPVRLTRGAPLAPDPSAARLPNLLLISLDTLRSDHLGCYGYPRPTSPFIDSLAREGALFEQSTSQASWTRPSAASLVTSLYPSSHGVLYMTHALAPGTVTLPGLLQQRGYRTAVFSANTNVSTTFGFGQGVHEFYESLRPRLLQRTLLFETLVRLRVPEKILLLGHGRDNAANLDQDRTYRDRWVVEQFRGWVARARPQPFFAYLHLLGGHAPYRPPPPYDVVFARGDPDVASENPPADAGNVLISGQRVSEPRRQRMIDAYDGLVRFSDDQVRAVFEALPDAERERTVVVVTGDHGEAFWDHQIWGHGGSLYEAEIRVPLVLWAGERVQAAHPGLPRGALQVPVCTVDVMPTLLALARAACPACEGESLLDLAKRGRRTRPILIEQYMTPRHYSYAVRDSRFKLVFTDFLRGRLTRWELFDLAQDPEETSNLLSGPPGPEIALAAEMVTLRSAARARRGQASEVLLEREPAVYEELRALGYLR